MLEFIDDNGVLFSGIFSIIVALISVLVSVIRDNKKSKLDTIRSLRKELDKTREELSQVKTELVSARSIEEAEKNIDKTRGSIYYEKFANGGERTICGFCWEKEHIKIPIVADMCYEEYTHQAYYSGYCNSCKAHCVENIEADTEDQNLPF